METPATSSPGEDLVATVSPAKRPKPNTYAYTVELLPRRMFLEDFEGLAVSMRLASLVSHVVDEQEDQVDVVIDANIQRLGELRTSKFDHLFEDTAAMNSLEILNASLKPEMLGFFSEALSKSTFLTSLVLSRCKLTSQCMSVLVPSLNGMIEHLDLSHNHIGDEGTTQLIPLTSKSVSLNSLNLSNNSLTSIGLTPLLEQGILGNTSSPMRSLDISLNSIDSSEGLVKVISNAKLTSLSIGGCGISGECLYEVCTALEGKTSILHIDFSGEEASPLWVFYMAGLIGASSLPSIALTNCKIDAYACSSIALTCYQSQVLYSLNISDNPIHDSGALFLNSVLTSSSVLQHLNLANCSLMHQGFDVLQPGLTSNSTLTCLSLAKNALVDSDMDALSSALNNNPNLRYLDISRNNVTSDGVKRLFKAVKNTCGLEQLNLGGNPIKDAGAEYVSGYLSRESCLLTTLDLSSCEISDTGAGSLEKALESCKSLSFLSLASNSITPIGASVVLEGLVNSSLHSLDLKNNCFHDEDVDSARNISNLHSLYLSSKSKVQSDVLTSNEYSCTRQRYSSLLAKLLDLADKPLFTPKARKRIIPLLTSLTKNSSCTTALSNP